MRQYAVVKDAISENIFAVIVKDDDFTVCHGIHPVGKKWAESYNKGLTKSIHDDLQPGITVGQFAPVNEHTQTLIDEASEGKNVRFPDYSQLVYVKSVNYRHNKKIPQVKDAGLSNIKDEDYFKAVDYKAAAFRADTARFSLLAKSRLGRFGVDTNGFYFTDLRLDQKALNEELFDVALGYGNSRRAAKEVILEKHLNLAEHPGYYQAEVVSPVESSIETESKRLGRRIGRGARGGMRSVGRSMKDPFDPNAWDGDNDGIVQEGTMWERPAVPGVNTNLPGQRHTRTKPREFPLDDADDVEFRLRARREDDRQMEEVLSTPVGELINSYPEETEVLDATLRGVDDEILDIPLRDLPNENLPVQLDEAGRLRTDGTSFDEENIDEILDNIVPRWNRTSPGATDSFYEGMRSQRGMRSERYDIAHDSRDGKWHVIDTGNNNMRTGRSFDKHHDALRDAIRMDNPRGGRRSQMQRSARPGQADIDERTHGELVDAFRSDGLSMSEAEAEADRRMRNRFGDRWRQHPLNRDRRIGRGSADPYYERGRRGMRSTRSRARDASVDRASQIRGMRSSRGRGRARPGIDRFSDIDGQIWESLTDAERASVADAVRTEMRRRMHGLAWSNLPQGARKPKQKKNMTPEEEAEHVSYHNPMGAMVRQYFDKEIRPDLEDRYTGDELDQRLADYVLTDEDIDTIEAMLYSEYEATGAAKPLTIDQFKDQLREIRIYRGIVEESESEGQDAFRFREHLTPTQRGRIFDRANGPEKDRLKTTKASWGLSTGNQINSTIGTTFAERQANIEAQTGARRRVGQFSRSMSERIWTRNENNRLRRALRRARRAGGQGGLPGFRRDENEGRSAVARRVAAAKRKFRTVKGRKGIQGALKASEKNQTRKAIDFDSDDKLVIGEEGMQRISAAAKALLGDRDALKEVRMKSRGTDTDEANRAIEEAREALGKIDPSDTEALEAATEALEEAELRAQGIFNQNLEMAVIWDKQGMNGLPTITDEDTFNDLIDAGYAVIGRGHGSQSNAADYLDDELRYLPGGGGEAAGKGEYWSDPRGQWSSWTAGNGNTVAVLGPNARRMSREKLDSEADANKSISNAFELFKTSYTDELELTQALQTDPDTVIAQMDAEIAKITNLADAAPIWETEIGQLWKHLRDSIRENGDPDSLHAMLLLSKLGNTRGGRNLIAPILGYDTIQYDSRELVMNRSALIALGKTADQQELEVYYERARQVREERQ